MAKDTLDDVVSVYRVSNQLGFQPLHNTHRLCCILRSSCRALELRRPYCTTLPALCFFSSLCVFTRRQHCVRMYLQIARLCVSAAGHHTFISLGWLMTISSNTFPLVTRRFGVERSSTSAWHTAACFPFSCCRLPLLLGAKLSVSSTSVATTVVLILMTTWCPQLAHL
jgi:hypothetical protein